MKYEVFTRGRDLKKPNDGVLTDFRWPRNGLLEIQYYEPANSCAQRAVLPYEQNSTANNQMLRSRRAMCKSVMRAVVHSQQN